MNNHPPHLQAAHAYYEEYIEALKEYDQEMTFPYGPIATGRAKARTVNLRATRDDAVDKANQACEEYDSVYWKAYNEELAILMKARENKDD